MMEKTALLISLWLGDALIWWFVQVSYPKALLWMHDTLYTAAYANRISSLDSK